MFKFHHKLLPCVFDHTPTGRLESVRRGIRVQGVYYWNIMFDKVDYNCSLVTYKFYVKRFLLENTLCIV